MVQPILLVLEVLDAPEGVDLDALADDIRDDLRRPERPWKVDRVIPVHRTETVPRGMIVAPGPAG